MSFQILTHIVVYADVVCGSVRGSARQCEGQCVTARVAECGSAHGSVRTAVCCIVYGRVTVRGNASGGPPTTQRAGRQTAIVSIYD